MLEAPLVEESVRPSAARRSARGAAIASLATALPPRVVTSESLAQGLGVNGRWITRRTGVEERHYMSDGETLTALATRAGSAALEQAGLAASEVDMILVGTCTPDQLLPHTSALVAAELGADTAALDVGGACMGFLALLSLATAYVESGRADRLLAIGADQFSRFVDPRDRQTVSIFGDGAGAVVLTATDDRSRIGPFSFHVDGAGAPLVYMTHEDHAIRMDGPETFKHAVVALSSVTDEAVAAAGLERGDVDLFVYHQANSRILEAVGERLGLPRERVVDNIAGTGNTSAASIPLALDAARADGRLRDGARVLVSGIGAGFVWGATVIEWGSDA